MIDIEQFTTADYILYAAKSSKGGQWMLQNYGQRTLMLEIDHAAVFVEAAEEEGLVVKSTG